MLISNKIDSLIIISIIINSSDHEDCHLQQPSATSASSPLNLLHVDGVSAADQMAALLGPEQVSIVIIIVMVIVIIIVIVMVMVIGISINISIGIIVSLIASILLFHVIIIISQLSLLLGLFGQQVTTHWPGIPSPHSSAQLIIIIPY